MLAAILFLVWCESPHTVFGQNAVFEDSFDDGLSDQWQISGLEAADYRVHDGALEVRVKAVPTGQPRPMLFVNLPFTTTDTLVASVEVTVVGERLRRGELAGLCLTHNGDPEFTVRKTDIDGYFVFAPGEPDFIGQPGEEGDPSHYTVKYWPAQESFGPLNVMVRGDYAYFQVGPSSSGEYRTFFHSAIQEADEGLGFGLIVDGGSGDGERWVRFDNFRVTGP
jgi:hypothetical protein